MRKVPKRELDELLELTRAYSGIAAADYEALCAMNDRRFALCHRIDAESGICWFDIFSFVQSFLGIMPEGSDEDAYQALEVMGCRVAAEAGETHEPPEH